MKPLPRGMFISFEGGDKAGKSTLIQNLKKRFIATTVVTTREPGGCLLGEEIRKILLSTHLEGKISAWAELALFLAARAQHVEEVILPALQEGKTVLCDRFGDSSLVYQGGGRKLGMDCVEKLTQIFSQNLIPDITFYLDLDPQLAKKRGSSQLDRMEKETVTFQETIRNSFLALVKKYPERIICLDASLSPIDLEEQAWRWIQKKAFSVSL